jgi:uncharacterized UPF0160 family protein
VSFSSLSSRIGDARADRFCRHFGKEIIANRTQTSLDDPQVTTLWLKLYKEFIEAIDAVDNGISQYLTDIKPKYRNRTDLSARVGWLNPAWNQSVDSLIVDVGFCRLHLAWFDLS